MNERKVIGGGRRRGKTTKLIMLSKLTGKRILCANQTMANEIKKQARDMGIIDLPEPITPSVTNQLGRRERVLVDEIEVLIQEALGVKVDAMSTSLKMEEMQPLRKEKCDCCDCRRNQ